MQFCPNCGKQIPEEVKFCPYCGAEIPQKKPSPSTPVKKHQQKDDDYLQYGATLEESKAESDSTLDDTIGEPVEVIQKNSGQKKTERSGISKIFFF